jgi:ubiquinone/menaquinone biosynthesis C-methylase UbiE
MIQREHERNVEDGSFDVILSIFGHMFALHPEIDLKEMLRVTKSGGCIGFTIWSTAELLNGKMFEAIAKHMPSVPLSPSNNNSPSRHNHILQCIVEIQKSYRRLDINGYLKYIHFEEGIT